MIRDQSEKEAPSSGVVPLMSEYSTMASSILRTAMTYFSPREEIPRLVLENTIEEAIKVSDENFGIQAAVAWAGGYEFPQEMIESDLRCFKAAQLDFETMVRRRLKILSSERLSKGRVDQLRSDNPERTLLYDLVGGMRVPLPPGFKPNGKEPSAALRATYVKVHPAVNRMLGDVVKSRLAFLLPKELAVQTIKNLHLSSAHWATKKGKPSGRPIGDMTYVQGTPLNSPEATARAVEFYGVIEHPTIDRIIKMVLEFWDSVRMSDPTARWEDIRIWKMDLKGAYTLLSFRPEDAGLFGMEVTGNLVYLQIAGIFGWSCTPAAFQVVTRALKHELNHALKSSVDMYVDDTVGCCLDRDLESDKALARGICTSLLGPNAIADEKTESGTRLDVIGYVIDLSLKRVSISRKNHLNAIYGFMTVDLSQPMALKMAQKLASWGSRYGRICRAMRPFCGALHRLTAGRDSRHATFMVSDEAKIAVRAWRAMLFLLRYDEERWSRTLESFSDKTPVYIVEFDASLKGAGVLWYQRVAGAEVCLGGSAVSLECLDFGDDSSFQNLSEYIGGIIGLIGLVKMGVRKASIEMRGDSVSALTWAQTERYRGERVTNASMVFTALCVNYQLDVQVATHISGVENHRCDALSRLKENESIEVVMNRIGLGGCSVLDLEGCPSVHALVSACAATTFVNEDQFIEYWGGLRDAVRDLEDELV